jgi:hypothetical protein
MKMPRPKKESPKLTDGYSMIAVPDTLKKELAEMKRDKEAYYEVIIRLIRDKV